MVEMDKKKYIVTFHFESLVEDQFNQAVTKLKENNVDVLSTFPKLGAMYVECSPALVELIKQTNGVASVEEELQVKASDFVMDKPEKLTAKHCNAALNWLESGGGSGDGRDDSGFYC